MKPDCERRGEKAGCGEEKKTGPTGERFALIRARFQIGCRLCRVAQIYGRARNGDRDLFIVLGESLILPRPYPGRSFRRPLSLGLVSTGCQ